MSRFKGWTEAAISRIENQKGKTYYKKMPQTIPNTEKQSIPKKGIDYVPKISEALSALKIKHELEYKFLHDRRFKFDLAIPSAFIAIEFEGGIFTQGRHTRGKGYASDVKKYNLAVMNGWKLLRYTSEDTKALNWQFEIAEEIQKLINKRGTNESQTTKE
jgi:hypothetical protein